MRISRVRFGSALCTVTSWKISASPALNAPVTQVPGIGTAMSMPPAPEPTLVSSMPCVWDPAATASGPFSRGQSPSGIQSA